ncbi:putative superoxide dismutase 1 copper chaperone protein [Eutypa lata UCREL1]|uniref:Superoxide dismutase 1 copper chaperone n=1 Tax=Eutypa lata (strain UCR-EL1) TaxID=1287681 RepID=M7U1E2_EUTLA|nr:putative superoxide dismutase 1 copper chaperone protein [Eutypa lata UCREL1]
MATTQNKIKTPFQTLFAVPMTCDSCVKSVSDALYSLDGITNVDVSLKDQLVTVEGTAAPSTIVSTIEETGRDAILRGSGSSNTDADPPRQCPTDAAVAILETYHHSQQGGDELVPASAPEAATTESGFEDRHVRGLARIVQVSPETTLLDLTVRGVVPGVYSASIREYGDLKYGATSTGPIWIGGSSTAQPRGLLGTLTVGKDGRGAVFLDHPFQVWEVIGHAIVVSSQEEGKGDLKNDENTIVGVVARSAGVWDNDKTVCSCTGKTLWQERKDEVKKGMI